MDSVVTLINEVGFPIAAAIGLGLFIWKLINKIIDGMETKVDVLDEKVSAQIAQIEEQITKETKKASGKQKLKDLGLDDDEIKALTGA